MQQGDGPKPWFPIRICGVMDTKRQVGSTRSDQQCFLALNPCGSGWGFRCDMVFLLLFLPLFRSW